MREYRNRNETEEHGSDVSNIIDLTAHAIISHMSPLEIGKMIHPSGEAVVLCNVPKLILAEHGTRYSQNELEAGQFFKVQGKFTFIMDHEAKKARGQ
jgi:hypothetical protein